MTTQHCPSCANKILKPYGSKTSGILIIGDSPSDFEMRVGKPFLSAPNTTGYVLRKELVRAGIDIVQCRTMHMWLHKPPSKKSNNFENCFKAGLDVVLEEAKGKDAILLLGSDVVSYFTGFSVSEVSGLQVNSPMLSATIIYACYSPGIVFKDVLGEIRFAITQFIRHLEQEEII